MMQGSIVSAVVLPMTAHVTVCALFVPTNAPKEMEFRVVQTGEPWPEDDVPPKKPDDPWDAEWDSPRWLHYATAHSAHTGATCHVIGRFTQQRARML